MNITFNKLRELKHRLPTGSVKIIATELGIEEQTVRNFFGAKKYENGSAVGKHIQPGPDGGVVHIDDVRIFELAQKLVK